MGDSIVYNRYQGRYIPNGSITVDAGSLAVAAMIMTQKHGGEEPNMISLIEKNVLIATSSPTATFSVNTYEGDTITPVVGRVYPPVASLPIGNSLLITAVPNEGYEFVKYTDMLGNTLSENKEYTFALVTDTQIKAIFKKLEIDPADLSLNVTLSKLLRVNYQDGNYEQSQQNQDMVSLSTTVDTNTNTIYASFIGDLASLNSFASTNPSQGTAKWLGLLVMTDFDYTKSTMYYNGAPLPAQEFKDSNYLGVPGNGNFIVWVKAEEIAQIPKKFTIYSEEKRKIVTISVGFKNTI